MTVLTRFLVGFGVGLIAAGVLIALALAILVL